MSQEKTWPSWLRSMLSPNSEFIKSSLNKGKNEFSGRVEGAAHRESVLPFWVVCTMLIRERYQQPDCGRMSDVSHTGLLICLCVQNHPLRAGYLRRAFLPRAIRNITLLPSA